MLPPSFIQSEQVGTVGGERVGAAAAEHATVNDHTHKHCHAKVGGAASWEGMSRR